MPTSRASLQLAAWTALHSQGELIRLLEERLGYPVAQSTVSRWQAGLRLPRPDMVAALHDLLGIAPQHWYLPPGPKPSRRRGA
jgi:transcriptional regulator with XRE-family HTH domain